MTKQGSSFSHLHHLQKDLMNTSFILTQGTCQRAVEENREVKWNNITVEMAPKSAVSCCFLLLLSVDVRWNSLRGHLCISTQHFSQHSSSNFLVNVTRDVVVQIKMFGSELMRTEPRITGNPVLSRTDNMTAVVLTLNLLSANH